MRNFVLPQLPILRLLSLLIAFSFTAISPAFSQGNDSKGRDFWLMFNTNINSPTITVFITSDVNTSGTVTVPGIGFSAPYTVTANNVTPVVIPNSVATHTNNTIGNKGVHITALQEVTVYGLNYAPFTTDAYLGLPTDVLGTDYIILTYSGNFLSQLGVVATQNNTTVTITPSVAANGRAAGVPFNLIMNQGQTFQLGNASDMTGSIITSDKPIGVFGSNACANIPPNASFCDHIVEMVPPTTTWGRKFGTVPLKSRANGDTWRFLASENGTIVTINGVAEPAINRGQWREKVLTAQSVVESNKPILVAQYANGSAFSGNPGDPFIMLIPSLEQFLAKYTLTTVSGYVVHFINVVAPNSIVGSLTLDGAAVPASEFTPIGSSGFSGAKLTVTPGVHNLAGTLPFGVFQYGFNQDDSYGYPGGQAFGQIAIINTITLTPDNSSGTVGTEKCFEALVRDQLSNPLSGIRVDFVITGVNPSNGFAFTDANGVAKFCYTGANTGTDNIKASVGTLNDATNFTWNTAAPDPIANVYYSKAAGDLHNVLTWGVNLDGSGANPPDFTAGKTFNLANRGATYTMTGNWTVGGILNNPAGSELEIKEFTLSIASLTGAGKLAGSLTSNLIVAGTAGGDPGTLMFGSGLDSWLNNFTLNRTGTGASATVGSALRIFGVLTVMNGMLNTGGLVTLKSNATSTARVAPVLGSINGNVTVERYIPARRAWRLMNAPVGGTQTVNQAWQEGVTTGSPNPNPNPGFGTHITNTSVANGFDQNPGADPSLKWFNAANVMTPVTNTHTMTVGNRPFFLFVRGDRGITMGTISVRPTNTVLRATGPLKIGDQTFPVNAAGFTAIPNPFASPINYASITRNNVQNNFYLWDPKMGGTNGVGAYVNVSFNGTSYDVTPASVSPESQYIQSGQSFLVRSTGSAGSLVIKESDKSATAATNVFRATPDGQTQESNTPDNAQGLRVNLQVSNSDNSSIALLDEVYASYGVNFSNKVDEMDAIKMTNVEENLAIVSGDHTLMVDRRSLISENDILYLKLWNTVQKSYLMEFNPINLSSAVRSVTLEDKYLNKSTSISLSDVSQVYFNVNADVASSDPGRFKVILSTRSAQQNVTDNLGRVQFAAYPNPIAGRNINLQFVNAAKGAYHVELVNSIGQIVFRKDIQHPGGTVTQSLQLDRKLSKGVYQLQLRSKDVKTAIKILSNY